ncbi:MAG: acyl carrier protein [Chloroflexota bacterium]|jgi:acyl carrier protein
MTVAHALTKDQIKETIIGILQSIAPEADYDDLDPDAKLQETLDIDSFDFLNLLIGLDEAVGVSVPEADYGKLVSLNDLVDYLAERV